MPPSSAAPVTPTHLLPWQYASRVLAFVCAAELLFTSILYGPIFFPLNHFGIVDYDQFLAWQLAVNEALRSAQLLHWAHHFCGGVPGLADPQSGALSPFNLIGLFANPVVQSKISVALHVCASAVGFHWLTRRAGWPAYVAIPAFVIWIGNGFVLFRLLHGQETFYPLFYLPLMLALLWPYLTENSDGRELRRDLLAGAALFSLVILEDGFQVLIYAGIYFGLAGLITFIIRRDFTVLGVLAAWTMWAICLCAIRLMPMADLLSEYPRITAEQDFLTLGMLIDAFVNTRQLDLYVGFEPVPPHNVWAAYGAFVGWGPLLLFAGGVGCAWSSRSKVLLPILTATCGCFLLMLGYFADWSPWALLHRLPLIDMVRAPHRFSGMVIFSMAIFSMVAVAEMVRRINGSAVRGALIAFIVAGVCASGQFFALQPLLDAGFNDYQPAHGKITQYLPFTHQIIDSSRMYSSVAANVGVYNCYRALDLPNRVTPDLPLALPVGSGASVSSTIGPNTIALQVENATAEIILINENFHRHWTVVAGRAEGLTRTPDGLMALMVPPGKGRILLRFVPRVFIVGAMVSLVALLVSLLLLSRWRNPAALPRAGG